MPSDSSASARHLPLLATLWARSAPQLQPWLALPYSSDFAGLRHLVWYQSIKGRLLRCLVQEPVHGLSRLVRILWLFILAGNSVLGLRACASVLDGRQGLSRVVICDWPHLGTSGACWICTRVTHDTTNVGSGWHDL